MIGVLNLKNLSRGYESVELNNGNILLEALVSTCPQLTSVDFCDYRDVYSIQHESISGKSLFPQQLQSTLFGKFKEVINIKVLVLLIY